MGCNKCNQEVRDCSCNQITLESCVSGVCPEKLDAKCVIYNWKDRYSSNLRCFLGLDGDTSVHDIFEVLDRKLCELTINSKDEKVKTDLSDPTPGYLYDKITVGDCLIKSKSNNTVKIELDWVCICNKLNALSCIERGEEECTPTPLTPTISSSANNYCGSNSVVLTANNYNGTLQWYRNNIIIVGATNNTYSLIGEGGSYSVRNTTNCGTVSSPSINITYNQNCTCTPQATTPTLVTNKSNVIQGEQALLTASGCNGVLKWFNSSNVEIANSVSTLLVAAGSYYVECSTICNNVQSNIITITSNNGTWVANRTAQFTRNNCGNNNCGIAATSNPVTFTKTYNSNISQADADNKAATDALFNTEGQSYANTNGACIYPDTGFPAYSLLGNPATCTNNIAGSASIVATNVSNATSYEYKLQGASNFSVNYPISSNTFTIAVPNPTNTQDVYVVRVYKNKVTYPNCFTEQSVTINKTSCVNGCNIQANVVANPAVCVDGVQTVKGNITVSNITGLTSNAGSFVLNGGVSQPFTGTSFVIPNVSNQNTNHTIVISSGNCSVTYNVNSTQVPCTQATVTINKKCQSNNFDINITGGSANSPVRYCLGTIFTCSNTCNTPDITLNSSGVGTISNIPLPANGVTESYVVRIYSPTDNTCNTYYEKRFDVKNDCITCNGFTITNTNLTC